MFKPLLFLLLLIVMSLSFQAKSQELKVGIPTGISEEVYEVKKSPDGKLVGVLTAQNIQVWDAKREKRIYKMNPHSGRIVDFDFSPNSNYLASSSETGSVVVWDLENDKQIWKKQFSEYGCEQVAFHPIDNDIIYALSDELTTWNIKEDERLQSANRISDFMLGPNGKFIALRKGDELHVCNSASFEVAFISDQHKTFDKWAKTIKYYAFNTSGKYFYSLGNEDSTIVVVNLETKRIETKIKLKDIYYASVSMNEKNQIIPKDLEGYREVYSLSGEKLWPKVYVKETYSNDGLTVFQESIRDTTGKSKYFDNAEKNDEIDFDNIKSTFHEYRYAKAQNNYLLLQDKGYAQWIDQESLETVYSFQSRNEFLSVDLSKSGKKIVVADGQIITLFSLNESGLDSVKHSIEGLNIGDNIMNLTLINDDQDVLFTTSTAEVIALNLNTGDTLIFELPEDQDNKVVNNFEYHPSSSLLVGQSYSTNLWSGANRIIVWDANTGKIRTVFEHHSEIDLFSISPDGKMMVIYDGNDLILYEYATNYFLKANTFTQNTFWSFFTDLSFDPSGEYIMATSSDQDIVVIPVLKFASYEMRESDVLVLKGHENVVQELAYPRDENYFLTTSDDNTMKEWSLYNGELIADYSTGELQIITAYYNDKNEIVTVGSSGEIIVWDRENKLPKHTNYIVGESKLTLLPEGYYSSNSSIAKEVYFTKGLSVFLFEQFDLKYNRPDLILKALGSNDEKMINAYYAAYKKRLKKMGFTEDMLEDDFHLPEIEIENFEEMPTINDEGSIKLKLHLKDSKYKLDRINVWVNDVAIYGKDGISIRDEETKEYKTDLKVYLAKGHNKVQVSTLNQAGAESYRETFEIECKAGKDQPNLYMVTIGESEFEQSDFNLTYAAKDAKDVANIFSESKVYKEVFSKTLINEEVTKENVLSLKTFLEKASINDHVMVFIAGHGVLDANLDYFFATYDMDFQQPQVRGIAYEDLESLLDGIKPLKKTLLIDACHSGEIDKEEVELAQVETIDDEDIQFRAVKNSTAPKLGSQNTFELTKTLFTDLRKGTGATVISSAGGMEFAMEGDDWSNGLFTYCFINGIQSYEADLNGDNEIWLSEIKKYVSKKVSKLSNGRQKPTSRIENQTIDFRVW